MIVLLLAAGDSDTSVSGLPPMLTPIGGATVLERVADQVLRRDEDQLIVICREEIAERWHLEHALAQIDRRCSIIRTAKPTKGAACTALLAADVIEDDEELLVLAGDEFLRCDYLPILESFRQSGCDGGTATFNSWHPRYSFVEVKEDMVVRCAEKDPISNTATAGLYWFRLGALFVDAASTMIRKNASVNGHFFVCPSFNQLILAGKTIRATSIAEGDYVPLKTPTDVLTSTLPNARTRDSQ